MTLLSLLTLIPFYLLGTFPTGMLVGRLRGVDLSTQGSKNIGAANATRILGKIPGGITLGGDLLKGLLGVAIARMLSEDPAFSAWAGVATVAGHCFSLPPILRGGKGVATSLGVTLVLAPTIAVVALAIYALALGLTGISAIGSVTAALVAPVLALLFDTPDETFYALGMMAILILFRHRTNIERIIEGRK